MKGYVKSIKKLINLEVEDINIITRNDIDEQGEIGQNTWLLRRNIRHQT